MLAQEDQPSEPGSKSKSRLLLETLLIVAAAIGLAIGIQAFVVKPYKIPSGSMEPTLEIGQRILVNRIGTRFEEPHVGEIAVFHPPKDAEEQACGPTVHRVTYGGAACSAPVEEEGSVNFVKRIVAGPGDEIFVKEGHVYRDGVREKDPYIRPCGGVEECNFPVPIKIPPGHWFMMGDNRGNSDDSRFWGPVPTSWIIGEAFATYWPPDRVGIF
jgi:signal peptidase I